MVIHVVDRIDGTFAMPRHFFEKSCLSLLRCVAGLLFLVGPAYATIDTLFVRLVYKGS